MGKLLKLTLSAVLLSAGAMAMADETPDSSFSWNKHSAKEVDRAWESVSDQDVGMRLCELKAFVYDLFDFRKCFDKFPGADKLKTEVVLKKSLDELNRAINNALRDMPKEVLGDIERMAMVETGATTYDRRLVESDIYWEDHGKAPQLTPTELREAQQWTLESMCQHAKRLRKFKDNVSQLSIDAAKKDQVLKAIDDAADTLCDLSRKLEDVLQKNC